MPRYKMVHVTSPHFVAVACFDQADKPTVVAPILNWIRRANFKAQDLVDWAIYKGYEYKVVNYEHTEARKEDGIQS